MKSFATKFWKHILSYFLAGLFAILPLVITVAIVSWVVNFLLTFLGDGTWIGDKIEGMGRSWFRDANEIMATAVGWAIVLGVIFLLGVLVQSGAKKLLSNAVNLLLERIPLIGSIYGTASQFVGMMNKDDDSEMKGMSVVLCKFGKEGGAGVLALMPSRDQYKLGDDRYCIVYIPTSPVPMTGGLIYMPVDSVEPLDMSVDSLMSIYLSMGITSPQVMKNFLVPAGS